jgi:hypothetical protein
MEFLLLFTSLWFVIRMWLHSEKYIIVSWMKKEFKHLEYLLVFFSVYFVEDNSCIFSFYSVLLLIYIYT